MLPEIEHLSLKYRNNKTGGVWLVRTIIYGDDEPGSYNDDCINISNCRYALKSFKKIRDIMFSNWGRRYAINKFRSKNHIEYILTDQWNSPQVSVILEVVCMSDG